MNIYHIVMPDSWAAQKDLDEYEHESLAGEGFIHCSYAAQVPGVLGRYYTGVDRVIILTIDPVHLEAKLVEEASTGGEIYPHIYGKINKEAIINAEERIV